jgi:hypothetical protein
MKKHYKIYYYFTCEKRDDGMLDRFTNYFICLKTIILKVKSIGSILNSDIRVSVLRPDIRFLTKLPSFYYELNLREYLEKINTSEEVGLNIKYLLKNVEYELERISEEG